MLDENNFCQECGKIYKNEKLYKRHYKMVHVKEESICTECGDTFTSKLMLKNHKRVHKVEEANVKCVECDKMVKKTHCGSKAKTTLSCSTPEQY